MKPAFSKEGSVTAGNASGLNDGAAAVILMKASRAKELGLKPLAKIKAYSSAGVDPKIMGMGPVPASELCLRKASWKHQDVDLMEINEAFAAQAIGVKMADAGFKVVVTHSLGNKNAAAWVADYQSKGYTFAAYGVDVADYDSCTACEARWVRSTS